jgi:hypothetical protein
VLVHVVPVQAGPGEADRGAEPRRQGVSSPRRPRARGPRLRPRHARRLVPVRPGSRVAKDQAQAEYTHRCTDASADPTDADSVNCSCSRPARHLHRAAAHTGSRTARPAALGQASPRPDPGNAASARGTPRPRLSGRIIRESAGSGWRDRLDVVYQVKGYWHGGSASGIASVRVRLARRCVLRPQAAS